MLHTVCVTRVPIWSEATAKPEEAYKTELERRAWSRLKVALQYAVERYTVDRRSTTRCVCMPSSSVYERTTVSGAHTGYKGYLPIARRSSNGDGTKIEMREEQEMDNNR